MMAATPFRLQPETALLKVECTDAGNADRLAHHYGQMLRFVPAWGWLCWDGKRWQRSNLRARELMVNTARNIAIEAALMGSDDKQAYKERTQWCLASQAAGRITAALFLAQPLLLGNPEEFDSHPLLVNVRNGTIELDTGQLRQHRREDFLTKLIDIDYDPAAKCPLFTRFLRRILPDPQIRAYLQRAVGYSLSGATDEQVLFFLYGVGANGKSVLLAILELLLGEYSTTARMESFTVQKNNGIPNDIAALSGARLVTVSEVADGQRLNETLVKDLTGGDRISARFLHREFFTFRPAFKLWIRGNHRPVIRGTDAGIWRRIHMVPFTVQIPEKERDARLFDRLKGELPGILARAVEGALQWRQTGLRPPAAVSEAVREYRADMDVVGAFLTDCCVVSPEREARAKDLYAEYQEWCEENSEQAVSQRRFGIALTERGFIRHRTAAGYSRLGLALRR